MAAKKVLLIGYVPGLTPGFRTTEDVEMLQELIEEQQERVYGALWMVDGTDAHCALVVDDATAIYEHLMLWCEGDPEAWFKFTLSHDGEGYAAGLVPPMQKSVARFNLAQMQEGEAIYSPRDFQYYSVPLVAYCETTSIPQIWDAKRVTLSLVNMGDLDPSMVAGDVERIIKRDTNPTIGQFDVIVDLLRMAN